MYLAAGLKVWDDPTKSRLTGQQLLGNRKHVIFLLTADFARLHRTSEETFLLGANEKRKAKQKPQPKPRIKSCLSLLIIFLLENSKSSPVSLDLMWHEFSCCVIRVNSLKRPCYFLFFPVTSVFEYY